MNSNQKLVSVLALAALIIFLLVKLNPDRKSWPVADANYAPIADTSGLMLGCDQPDCMTDSTLAYPAIFEAAYHTGTTATQAGESYYFSPSELGKLKVESGKIIAGDPILLFDAIAFTQTFPIGEFPVELASAIWGMDAITAFSRIKFSDRPVVKWELALLPGQEPVSLNDSSFFCFSVDAGQAVFIDEQANTAFNKRGQDEWNKAFMKPMETGSGLNYMHPFGPYNLAAFMAGWGDGCYATYIGYDSTGTPCRLLADFGIFNWWDVPDYPAEAN